MAKTTDKKKGGESPVKKVDPNEAIIKLQTEKEKLIIENTKLKQKAKEGVRVNSKTFYGLIGDMRDYLHGRDIALGNNDHARKHLGRVFASLSAAETQFGIYREKSKKK